jgi:fructosamine-3-kinase
MLDELGNWRPPRNNFTHRYFEAYNSIIPKAEPEADFDDRNALYALQVFPLEAGF